jgi:hypothetical protein
MADFKQSPIHKRGLICSAEKHLWKHGGVVIAIYSKVSALTRGGESTYFTSVKSMSEFLCCSERQARHGFEVLDSEGWLKIITPHAKNLGQLRALTHSQKVRRIIPHQEWVQINPGKCFEREATPWDNETHDRLGAQLYRLSDGKLRWYAQELKSIRKSGLQDSEILAVFHGIVETQRTEMLSKRAAGEYGNMKWRGMKWDFIKQLSGFNNPPTV